MERYALFASACAEPRFGMMAFARSRAPSGSVSSLNCARSRSIPNWLPSHAARKSMWDDAEAYDVATGWYEDDLRYWEDLVDLFRPTQVLELACGTGRVTLPLAASALKYNRTARIIGLDSSSQFLARARKKLAAASPTIASAVTFVEGDM